MGAEETQGVYQGRKRTRDSRYSRDSRDGKSTDPALLAFVPDVPAVPWVPGFYTTFDSWSAHTRPDITLGRNRVDLAGSIWPPAMAAAKAAGCMGGSQTPVPRSPAATWLHSSSGW